MSQPGIGAMLHDLSGGSEQNPDNYYGKTIKKADFKNDALSILFVDGVKIYISDNGQSCCETRYMRTDDDVEFLNGKELIKIEVKLCDNLPDQYGEHECVFLEIMVSDGPVTFSFHNEHNGYYGGFGLDIREVQP